MCFNCGCHNPQDDMGNPDNITEQMLSRVANDAKIDLKTLKQTLFQYLSNPNQANPTFENLFSKAAKAWGQSVEDAKRNTTDLLESESKS